MSTGVIIVLIVIVVGVVAAAAALALRARGATGGSGLKRRFGPEYDRTVARHDGDAKAAEQELDARVQEHGSLHEQPLEPAAREQYQARWAAAQERFVDSPREAMADVDQLLGEVAGARGFPDVAEYDKQFDALSVHHADHVHGYQRVHGVVTTPTNGTQESQTGTEEMREAMLEARALFDDLVSTDNGSDRGRTGRHALGSFNRQAVKGS
ncbi:hypothetical protein [Streptomyces xylophagus]|uniref:hypothetical protein n=1 Tax=Streptomyces xylophagus TaxID=285514 RepID=UPI0005B98F2E|nr:hypothetical protein [Streptomyces xylophagus]